MDTRREELQKLSVKNGLRPIAKSLGIRNFCIKDVKVKDNLLNYLIIKINIGDYINESVDEVGGPPDGELLKK